jgi:hypothetical protein
MAHHGFASSAEATVEDEVHCEVGREELLLSVALRRHVLGVSAGRELELAGRRTGIELHLGSVRVRVGGGGSGLGLGLG